jgi:hypothetical protein
MFIPLHIVALLALAACSTPNQGVPAPDSLSASPTTGRAQFAAFPDQLFEAAAATCSKPFETLFRPSKSSLRCEALPPPDVMAQIILTYDGHVEDLPRYILKFDTEPNAEGYIAQIDFYLDVPQRNAAAKHIKFKDAGVQWNLDRLLKKAGGRPITQATP